MFRAAVEKQENNHNHDESSASADGPPQPPLNLIQCQSLAIFCNGIIRTINQFRPCLTFELASHLKHVLEVELVDMRKFVEEIYQ